MKTQAIIPTAGLGTRMQSKTPKPFMCLNEKPLFIYTLEKFEKSELVDSVILVVSKENLKEFESCVKKYRLKKVRKIVVGGDTRKDSVFCGIGILDEDTECVLVHDGARPLIQSKRIDEIVELLNKVEAVTVGVPVKPTLKRVNLQTHEVVETLNRDEIYEIQTPQGFKKELLVQAHESFENIDATDDAGLVEKLGNKVRVLVGDYTNIKVTTQEDLVFAQAIIESEG